MSVTRLLSPPCPSVTCRILRHRVHRLPLTHSLARDHRSFVCYRAFVSIAGPSQSVVYIALLVLIVGYSSFISPVSIGHLSMLLRPHVHRLLLTHSLTRSCPSVPCLLSRLAFIMSLSQSIVRALSLMPIGYSFVIAPRLPPSCPSFTPLLSHLRFPRSPLSLARVDRLLLC